MVPCDMLTCTPLGLIDYYMPDLYKGTHLQPGVIFFHGDTLHLDVDAQWQLLDCNTRTRRFVLVKIFGIAAVESSKLTLHIGQKHSIFDDMVQ